MDLRDSIVLSDTELNEGVSDVMLRWRRGVQDQLTSMPTFIRTDDENLTTFPSVPERGILSTVNGTYEAVEISGVRSWRAIGSTTLYSEGASIPASPPSIQYATNTTPGIIRIATAAETLGGILDTVAITPARLEQKLNLEGPNQARIYSGTVTNSFTIIQQVSGQFFSVAAFGSSCRITHNLNTTQYSVMLTPAQDARPFQVQKNLNDCLVAFTDPVSTLQILINFDFVIVDY